MARHVCSVEQSVCSSLASEQCLGSEPKPNRIRTNVSLTDPKCGHRLGTSSATWKKIKLAAVSSRKEDDGGEDSQSTTFENPVVEQGPNGELCIWYPTLSTFELWAWSGQTALSRGEEDGLPFYVPAEGENAAAVGDCLQLQSQFTVPGRKVLAMAFMQSEGETYFLNLWRGENLYLEIRLGEYFEHYTLPEYLVLGIVMKVSSDFVCISCSEGYIYVLERGPTKDQLLCVPNGDGSLQAAFARCTLPTKEKDRLEDGADSLLFKTCTSDGDPIFDVVGSWLVYAPTKFEVDYFRQLLHSSDSSSAKPKDLKKRRKLLYTPVKLPPAGPLFLRVVSTLSNSAFDKLFQLSEFSTKKFRGYLSRRDKIMDKDVSLHSISSSIGNAMYSTANKLKKHAMALGENEIIKIVDLSSGQIMATFKPPGGISHLSLSAYDLQLVQANYKGDNFYMWDLYKLPTEVSLIGKFVRGKTSANIKQMCWFMNNKNTDTIPGSNSGFGCITKKTGTVHWYNINYLSCGNESKNYPNVLNGVEQDVSSGQFSDSWLLPSINAVKFCTLPGCSNVPSKVATYSHGHDPVWKKESMKLNQLAFLDSENNLKLVSPLNGKHTFKYILPTKPIELDVDRTCDQTVWNPALLVKDAPVKKEQEMNTPLSQTEIETCSPYLSIINNKNVEIATYDFAESSDSMEGFKQAFETFGMDLPLHVLDFRFTSVSTTLTMTFCKSSTTA